MQPPLHIEYLVVLWLIPLDVDHAGDEQTVQQCRPH